MKFTLLLAFAFVNLITGFIPLFGPSEWVIDEPKSRKDDAADFFEGLFSHFNLSSPSQINECFKESNAKLYFRLIEATNQILIDTIGRNSVRLHLEFIKMSILHKRLEQTHACMIMTQDFTDLLDALKLKDRSLLDLRMALHLYYQAHYIDLYEEFQPIIEYIEFQDNRQAGVVFGALLEDIVIIAQGEGMSHLAWTGFANGFAIGLGLEEPQDSLQCYSDGSAFLLLEFIYDLVATVAEGTAKESELNTLHFIAGRGKEIMGKIPKSALTCDVQSKDHQAVAAKLGIDSASSDFRNLMLRFINDHRVKYYGVCKELKKAIDNANLHHAGFIYANFFKLVASSKR